MHLELNKASDRNTPSHWLRVGGLSILFSYETAIAFRTFGKHAEQVRRHNHWGPTTGRHFKDACAYGYEIVTDEEFDDRLKIAFKRAVAEL